jgi:hypothetical protein
MTCNIIETRKNPHYLQPVKEPNKPEKLPIKKLLTKKTLLIKKLSKANKIR